MCPCVCPSPHSHTTAGCNLGNGRECRLVVHYLADLQSVHGYVAMTTHTYVSIQPYTLQMHIAPNAKCQLVLALCLVSFKFKSAFSHGRPFRQLLSCLAYVVHSQFAVQEFCACESRLVDLRLIGAVSRHVWQTRRLRCELISAAVSSATSGKCYQ